MISHIIRLRSRADKSPSLVGEGQRVRQQRGLFRRGRGRGGWLQFGQLVGAFQQVVVDLSSFAGKTVTIRFRIGTDQDGKGLDWYIDDVSLRGDRVSCAPTTE